jgi:hypothetical protein
MTYSLAQQNAYERLKRVLLAETQGEQERLREEAQECPLCEQRFDFWSPNIEPHSCDRQ